MVEVNHQTAITVKNLVKRYKNGVLALKGIDFFIKKGDCFALLGPNGAGKSTTIGILTSLVKKTSGKIWIHGIDIDENFPEAKRFLGIVPQEFNFNIFESVLQIVTTQAGYYGIPYKESRKRAAYFLRQLDLWDERHTQARHLSGGFKRRLMIARGLIHNPQILILDEPTANVDIEIRRSILSFIKTLNQQGITIILTTHYLEEAENLCKTVAIINQGQIITHTEIQLLIKQLDTETFILNVDNAPGNLNTPGFYFKLINNHTLEVEVKKPYTLNELFNELTKQRIQVLSLKNKANRLEELFVKLTSRGINSK